MKYGQICRKVGGWGVGGNCRHKGPVAGVAMAPASQQGKASVTATQRARVVCNEAEDTQQHARQGLTGATLRMGFKS